MSQSEAGKGDKRRPEDSKAYADGWERIFGKVPTPVPDGPLAGDTEGATTD